MGLENLFNYDIKENDNTIESELDKKKSCGYKRIEPFIYDRSYAVLNDSILRDEEIISSGLYQRCSTDKKFIKKSVGLWKDLDIRLHRVLFINKSSEIKLVHPSDLPVKLVSSSEYTLASSRLSSYEYFTSDSADVETLKSNASFEMDENGVLMEKIELPIIGNRLTSCCYNHEITHTQLLSVKESCTDILNSETLPFFIGEVFASAMDKSGKILRTLRNDSLISYAENLYSIATSQDISFKDRVEFDTYNKSILQAIYLSNIYHCGNDSIKNEIRSYIGKIFDGEKSVEDMLDKYEAHVENVPKDIAVLRKTL